MASKREIEAGKAVVVLGMDASPLMKGLDAAQAKLASFGKGVAAFGAGLAMAGALVTAPMLYGLSVFSEMGSEISKASRISGIGLEDLQTLSAALKVSFEELATASKKMDQFISHAAAGAPDAANRLSQLGLSVAELSQLSEGDRLRRIGEAINRTYSDVSQRHAAMTDIFGRSGLNLDFSGDVGGRENRRRELGGVMSPADVELAKEYSRAQKEMGIAIQGLWARIGSTAAPAMRDFFNLITRGVVYVQQLVDANRPLLEIVFRVADGMVTAGAVIGALGGAIYAASYAFLFIKGAILITGSALSWLWGIVSLASGGFGALTVAGWIWSAACMAWTGVMWLFNASAIVGHLVTWGWIAALVALGVACIAVQLAIVGGVVAIAAFAAYALYSSGIVQAAWDAIVDVFQAGVRMAGAAVDWLTDKVGAAWRYVTSLFGGSGGGFLSEAWTYWANAAGTAVNTVTGMFTRFAGGVSSTFTQTISGISTMFSGLAATGTQAFAGIRDAFAVGDWQTIWEIVKVSAQLAWAQIVAFIEPTFNIWKDLFFDTFNAVWDGIRALFETGWAFIASGWWTVAASILSALQGPITAVRGILESLAVIDPTSATDRALAALNRIPTAMSLTIQANVATAAGTARAAQIQQESSDRDWNEMYTRTLRDFAAQQGNDAEVSRLQAELGTLTVEASIAAMDPSRWTLPQAPNVDSGMLGAGKFGSLGTFSSSFADMFGGSSTAADRTAQNTRDAADAARRGAAAAEGILQRIGRGLVVR